MNKVILREHPSQFNNIDTDISYHLMLLHDGARMRAYYKAIDELSKRIKPERILDAGTGSGVWAIELAKAFPDAHIDAVDYHPDIVELARKQVSVWPELSDRIDVIQADLIKYSGKKYDLIITELDGGIGGNEGMRKIFINLENLLKENGKFIPKVVVIYTACAEILKYDIKGSYLNPLKGGGKPHTDTYYLISGFNKSGLLSQNGIFDVLGISPHSIIKSVERNLIYDIQRDGKLTGFVTWFIHYLLYQPDEPKGKEFEFSNSPSRTTTSWGQAYFPVKPFKVREGDKITLNLAEVITPAGPVPHYNWSVEKNGRLMGEYSNEKNQERRR